MLRSSGYYAVSVTAALFFSGSALTLHKLVHKHWPHLRLPR
jgi:hypothetical protein